MSTTSTTHVRVKAASSRVKNFFFGNLTAKAMALIMALALWFYAYSASRMEQTWTVPLEVGMTEGWALSGEEPKVTMTVACPNALSEDFKAARAANRIGLTATLTPKEDGLDEQALDIELGSSNLRAPSTLKATVRRLSPSQFTLRVVRQETKALTVDPQVSEPRTGFKLLSLPRAIPAKVSVRGPRDILSRVEKIETELVDIGNLTPLRGVTEKVPARVAQYVVVDGDRHDVVCNEPVQVQIALGALPKQKTFADVPIHLLRPPDYPYVVEIREGERATDVDVSGPDEVVDKLEPANIVLYVDVRDLKPNADTALPYTQPIYATVVETPRAGELTCRPALKNCSLTISEPETE